MSKANSGDMRKQQQVTYSGTNLSGPFVLYTQGQQYAGSAWSYYSRSCKEPATA